MPKCHCGRSLSPSHDDGEDDPYEGQHATRCCLCVDSFLFGAPDCETCEAEGER